MSREIQTHLQIVEAVKWNGISIDTRDAPAWLGKAADKDNPAGHILQAFSDLHLHCADGVYICNQGDYVVYFHHMNLIAVMKQRAFFLMMGGPVNEL